MPENANVLIVGAGMAGMTLGIALKRQGFYCRIVEVRPALTEPGTGITLQGPALRALRSVGALDGCVARGFPQSFFKTCDANGNVAGTVELPNLLGSPYPATVGIMRHEVHSTLAALLDELEVPVRLGVTTNRLVKTLQARTLLLRTEAANALISSWAPTARTRRFARWCSDPRFGPTTSGR